MRTRYARVSTKDQAIGKQLKSGGRFVALTISPHLVLGQLPPSNNTDQA